MVKKKSKEKEFIEKSEKVLKYLCIFTVIFLTLLYCIKGGFNSLLFDLRESKSVIVYCISIIILLILLVICNISEMPENQSIKQKKTSSYITVGILLVIALFSILLICTLIDFFLPIIAFIFLSTLAYFLVISLIKFLIKKYGLK